MSSNMVSQDWQGQCDPIIGKEKNKEIGIHASNIFNDVIIVLLSFFRLVSLVVR